MRKSTALGFGPSGRARRRYRFCLVATATVLEFPSSESSTGDIVPMHRTPLVRPSDAPLIVNASEVAAQAGARCFMNDASSDLAGVALRIAGAF